MGFFDAYPEFCREKGINSFLNRLNHRYQALIEANTDLIVGKRIIDIGCFDGRWAFAALKSGAAHTLGIDINKGAVNIAHRLMEQYQVRKEQYDFVWDDIVRRLDSLTAETVDTIFCLGIFYHIINHMEFVAKMAALKPKAIIVDTTIDTSPDPVIRLHYEEVIPDSLKSRVNPTQDNQILVGWPSKTAVEQMFMQFGFEITYHDWRAQGIRDWSHLKDYQAGHRITFVARPVAQG